MSPAKYQSGDKLNQFNIMANKENDLEKSKYDSNKDLQKEKEGRNPLEPRYNGKSLNENL